MVNHMSKSKSNKNTQFKDTFQAHLYLVLDERSVFQWKITVLALVVTLKQIEMISIEMPLGT